MKTCTVASFACIAAVASGAACSTELIAACTAHDHCDSCVMGTVTNTFICKTNYAGPTCDEETACNESAGDDGEMVAACLNGATCTVADTGAKSCACATGFAGDSCENRAVCTAAELAVCTTVNVDATCAALLNVPACTCVTGDDGVAYYGSTCTCLFDGEQCGNADDCTNPTKVLAPAAAGAKVCACTEGYAATSALDVSCDVDIDECATDVDECKNGSTCADIDGGYTCDCAATFSGDYCEVKTVACTAAEITANCVNALAQTGCEVVDDVMNCGACKDDWEGLVCDSDDSDGTEDDDSSAQVVGFSAFALAGGLLVVALGM